MGKNKSIKLEADQVAFGYNKEGKHAFFVTGIEGEFSEIKMDTIEDKINAIAFINLQAQALCAAVYSINEDLDAEYKKLPVLEKV